MKNVVYSRAILYSDGSGIETGVAFDPTYRLNDAGDKYVHVQGQPVRLDHVDHLIDWLREVQSLVA